MKCIPMLSENAKKRLMLALDKAERLKRLLNEILLICEVRIYPTRTSRSKQIDYRAN